MDMFLLKSNINNLGIKIDSAKLVNTTHNVIYNETLSYGVGNGTGTVKGSGVDMGVTDYHSNDKTPLFSINPLLTYTIVISFTLYKDYFIGSSNLGTYNIHLTHFPVKIID